MRTVQTHYRFVDTGEPGYTALTTVQRTKLKAPQLSTNNFAIARVLLTSSRDNALPYPKLLPQSCSRGSALPEDKDATRLY